MALNIYLVFNGNCQEVLDYYTEVFKAEKPNIMRYSDMPKYPGFELTDEMQASKDLVMHAYMMIHGGEVMFSDALPGEPVSAGNNMSITIVSNQLERMKAEFGKLSDTGEVMMKMQETFWSPAYGMVKDRFGMQWQFSYDEGDMGTE